MRSQPVVGMVFRCALLLSVGISLSGDLTPVAVEAARSAFRRKTPKIQLSRAGVGPRPDPRTGGFAKFSGKARSIPRRRRSNPLTVEIDTTSLFTEIDKLKPPRSPDFFEVRRFPTAKFESTKVEGAPRTRRLRANSRSTA